MMRIDYEMHERGMTQKALSDASGVSRVIINKIVRGHETPWPKWRDAIASALDWPLDKADELFEEIEVLIQNNAINVKLDDGAYMPERAHGTDAGADIRTPYAFTLRPHDSATVRTGVHVELPAGTVGMLKSKSGLNIKKGIVSEGVIDEGFTGEIIVKLYNNSPYTVEFEPGDEITQLVVMPVLYPSYEQADSIKGGERGNAGYGSTGR